ncbi:lytic transglycosylase domain-containing protein [Acinetobacter sp. A47]|uniref:lytic transglycosylase domain-containing protein n=1 Tax=Acinetobacter sp. A47 TaxID=1561217 RepID=UPI00068CDCBC|nr:lytic transglycosylase domain-containing protein [Acinetobacter sp. A47]
MSVRWNQLQGPDFRSGNALLQQGQHLMNQAIQGATQGAVNFAAAQEKQNTGKLLDYIHSARDPQQFQSAEFQGGLANLREQFGRNYDADTIRSSMDGRLGKLQADALGAQKYSDTMSSVADRPLLAQYITAMQNGDVAGAQALQSQFQNFTPEAMQQGMQMRKMQHGMDLQNAELSLNQDRNNLGWAKFDYQKEQDAVDNRLKAYKVYGEGSGDRYELGADGSVLQTHNQLGKFAPLIAEAADKHGVPTNLLAGLVMQESAGNPNARSKAGAQGLTQLMPGTAGDLGVTNPWDPQQNINGGARYLGQMIKKYGNLEQALMAYNWGPGNMDSYLKTGKGAKGQAMPKETREYASSLLKKAAGFNQGNPGALKTKADRDYMVATNTDKWKSDLKSWEADVKALPHNRGSKLHSLNEFKATHKKGNDLLKGLSDVPEFKNLTHAQQVSLADNVGKYYDSVQKGNKWYERKDNPITFARDYAQNVMKTQKTYDLAIPHTQNKILELKRNNALVTEKNRK